MHPVGPLNPKVYWLRRVSIVVLAVAVLIGMVWFLASRTSRSSAGQDPVAVVTSSAAPTLTGVLAASSGSQSTIPSPRPSPSSAATETVPGSPAAADVPLTSQDPAAVPPPVDPAAAATPTTDPAAAAAEPAAPAAEPAAPPVPPTPEPVLPSFDARGKLICPDSAIGLTAITAAATFGAGSQPTLGMVVTNTGTETCQRDVSGTLQTFTVYAVDGSRVWSTTDCFPGEGTDVRELTPGQTLHYTIRWSGTTSTPGCAEGRAPVPAGDYTVVSQLGGLQSPPAAFAITG